MFVTANSEVIYNVTRLIDVSKGPVTFYVPLASAVISLTWASALVSIVVT